MVAQLRGNGVNVALEIWSELTDLLRTVLGVYLESPVNRPQKSRRITPGVGESQPRVPTADGIRNLENRRVEVTYGPGSGM